MDTAVSVEEAWRLFRGLLTPLGPEGVPVPKSLGRIVAQTICSRLDSPAQDVAERDGYAVRLDRQEEIPRFRVVGGIHAGEVWQGLLNPGEALRIMTGAPLPSGADALLPVEAVKVVDDDVVLALKMPQSGAFIAKRGAFVRAGERVLPKGQRLGAEELAALSIMGYQGVKVGRRPQVAILPTGTELIRPGESRGKGQVFASHGSYLDALVRAEGGRATVEAPVPDHVVEIQEAIERNRRKHLVVTTGGTGPGDGDRIFESMKQMGAHRVFRGIKMRPGKTTALYLAGKCPVLALPGGFGAVRVCGALLVRPALRYLQGETPGNRETIECIVVGDIIDRDPRQYRFVEANVWAQAGQLYAAALNREAGFGGSLRLFGQGWIAAPPGKGRIRQGSKVRVLWGSTGLTISRIQAPCDRRERV